MPWFQITKKWSGHEPGEQVEMKADDAQPLIDSGYATAVTVNPEDAIVAKATEAFASRFSESLSKTADTFFDAANAIVKRPRIDSGEQSADKTKSFGDFLKSVYRNDHDRCQKVYGAKAALAEGSGVTGGYLVPPEFYAKLLQVEGENSMIRNLATVLEINGRTIQIPMLDQTTVQAAGVSPFFGGTDAKWADEAGSRPETEPQFKQTEMVAHELTGFIPASRTLIQDSGFALDQLLTTLFGRAIAWHEEYAFLRGDGVGKPRGILNAAATISVGRGTSTTFALVDAAKMWAKLLPGSMSRAVWIMSQSVIPQLIQMKDESNRVVFLPNPAASLGSGGPITQAMPMTLLGRPIYFTEKSPVLGASGDVLLADLSQYLIADRGTIEIAVSGDYLFRTNQVAWRFIKRVDGQPWLDNYITYADGSTTVSPFVKLT